jgi:hypothetical protein
MKLRVLFILLLLSNACRESTETNNIINPTIGGTYTEIEGNISGNLSFTDAPFLVNDDINVLASDTLVIDAGITLFFKDGKKLKVEGMIIAEGTNQDPIIFKPYLTSWLGISLSNSTGTSIFKFCTIQEVHQQRDDPFNYGAIEISGSNAVIENCVFKINSTIYGGGLSVINSSASIKNNIFINNDAEVYGGAIFLLNSNAVIINNTIYSNFCFNFGGGIVLYDNESTEIQNNIIFDNGSLGGDPRIAIASGDTVNIIEQFNFLAFGNMDPLFISEDNLHLLPQSPCINNGNPKPEYNDVNGTRNDQGAFGGPGGAW